MVKIQGKSYGATTNKVAAEGGTRLQLVKIQGNSWLRYKVSYGAVTDKVTAEGGTR